MRKWMSLVVLAMFGAFATADDKKGIVVEVSGLKATAPASWKEEKPTNQMRLTQFKLEKEKGDSEDAELVVFSLPGGGGVEANLKRQINTFKIPEGMKKEDAIKEDDVKIGEFKGKYQVLKGSYQYKSAPFDPNSKITEKEKFAQLYVIYEDDDKKSISFRVIGPEKTIEKHKKDFEAFIKSFKK